MKLVEFFDNHTLIFTIVVILLCWLPFLIFYYPGVSTGDTVDSLSQFFHLDTCWSKNSINLINDDIYINKHHSVLFTVTLGVIVSLGNSISSFNFGYYLYILIQVLVLLIIFGYMNYYFKKIEIPFLMRVFIAFFIGLTPIVKTFAICAVKDTLYAIFVLLYSLLLLRIVMNYNEFFKSKKRVGLLILVMLLVMLYKNNGIYIIGLSFPFLILLCKNMKKIRKILLILLLPLMIFFTYNNLVLPSFKVSNGSIKEAMTIPFMQLSRLAHYNKDVFTEKEIDSINKVITFSSMVSFYSTDNADSVKDTYNKDVTKDQLNEFYKVWFKYLKKYPNVYFAAFINSTYKYFYPEVAEDRVYLIIDYRIEKGSYFKLHQLDIFDNMRDLFNCFEDLIKNSPFMLWFNRVAFYSWYLIISFLLIIVKRQYRYLMPLIPLLIVFISCFSSPVNGSLRYMLPVIFSVPLITVIDYLVLLEKKKN